MVPWRDSSGNRDSKKQAELSYILEVCMAGFGNELHVERKRDGGDKNDFKHHQIDTNGAAVL